MSKWCAGVLAALTFVVSAGAARAQQPSQSSSSLGALSLPFASIGTGTAGPVETAGVLRIARFTEQNGRLFVVGTVTVDVPGASSSAANTSLVTQVAIPVLSIRGASGSAVLSFGGSAAAGTSPATGAAAPGSAVPGVPATGVSATAGGAASGTAGVPSSSLPGQAATCGPLRLEVGPVTVSQSTLALRLERVTVDLVSPAGLSSPVNELVCSAESAVSQAAAARATGNAASRTAGVPSVTGTTGTVGGTGSASQPTALQQLVAAMNRLVGAV